MYIVFLLSLRHLVSLSHLFHLISVSISSIYVCTYIYIYLSRPLTRRSKPCRLVRPLTAEHRQVGESALLQQSLFSQILGCSNNSLSPSLSHSLSINPPSLTHSMCCVMVDAAVNSSPPYFTTSVTKIERTTADTHHRDPDRSFVINKKI